MALHDSSKAVDCTSDLKRAFRNIAKQVPSCFEGLGCDGNMGKIIALAVVAAIVVFVAVYALAAWKGRR